MADGPRPRPETTASRRRRVRRSGSDGVLMLAGVLAIIGALAAGLLFRDAAGDAAHRGRSRQQRRRQGRAGADAGLYADPQPYPLAPGADRWRQPRAPRRWPTARSISRSSAATSTCRRTRRRSRRCARMSRCSGCPRPPRARARSPRPKITKIAQLAGRRVGVVGRTPANVNLLKVILQQYGVDPAKVEIVHFPATEVAEAIRGQKADAYLAAGPVNSKITADAIAASARDGGTPTFLAIDRAEAIAQNHPVYEASAIPAGAFGGSPDRPEEEVKTISFSHHIVGAQGPIGIDHRRLHPAIIRDPASGDGGIPAGRQNRDPGHRQGCGDPGASGRGGLCRRRGEDLPRPLQRLHLVGADGAVGDGLGRRMVRGLPEKGRAQHQSPQRERLLDMLAGRAAAIPSTNSTRCSPRPTTSCAIRCGASSMARSREGAMTAFNIALEQFHHAVADRKACLACRKTCSAPARRSGPPERCRQAALL